MRHHPRVLELSFKPDVKRAEKANLIDNYVNGYVGELFLDGEANAHPAKLIYV